MGEDSWASGGDIIRVVRVVHGDSHWDVGIDGENLMQISWESGRYPIVGISCGSPTISRMQWDKK